MDITVGVEQRVDLVVGSDVEHGGALEALAGAAATHLGRGCPAQLVLHAGLLTPDLTEAADWLEQARGWGEAAADRLALGPGVGIDVVGTIGVEDVDAAVVSIVLVTHPDHLAALEALPGGDDVVAAQTAVGGAAKQTGQVATAGDDVTEHG